MKNWIVSVFLLAGVFFASTQPKMSCCLPSATDAFAQLASDQVFVMSHPEPLPIVFSSDNGKDIIFKAADGSDAY